MPYTAFAHDVAVLANASEQLWQTYTELGPGKVPPAELAKWTHALDAAQATFAGLSSGLPEEIVGLWETALASCQLLRRAAERPEGLCFVTGEAGLIPRRADYARCEQLPQRLRALVAHLASPGDGA